MRGGRGLWRAGGLVGATLGLGGCIVVSAVGTTGELAATTVIVAGQTATAVVKTTGKIATSAINGGGNLTATSIDSLATLGQAGMVTFVDVTKGAVVRVPWQTGMTLYGGGAAAAVQVAERAVALVRGGKLVYEVARQVHADVPLQAGDVVRLAGSIGR
ncbi:MAG: hypothetical protein ACHQ4G_09285 [Opitutales bacterium]